MNIRYLTEWLPSYREHCHWFDFVSKDRKEHRGTYVKQNDEYAVCLALWVLIDRIQDDELGEGEEMEIPDNIKGELLKL